MGVLYLYVQVCTTTIPIGENMDKQELIRFLQDEADRALVDLFPQILKYLEEKYSVGKEVEVQLDLKNYPENVQATILGSATLKLKDLGYTVNSYISEDGNPCLGVS
jgi:hypothetical protein